MGQGEIREGLPGGCTCAGCDGGGVGCFCVVFVVVGGEVVVGKEKEGEKRKHEQKVGWDMGGGG